MDNSKTLLLAMTTVSAALPSIATVRLQRLEQDEGQRKWLFISGSIAFITVLGALYNKDLMNVGFMAMIGLYLFFLFAPRELL